MKLNIKRFNVYVIQEALWFLTLLLMAHLEEIKIMAPTVYNLHVVAIVLHLF